MVVEQGRRQSRRQRGEQLTLSEETRRVADYAVRLRYGDLPPEVLERAKNTIADTIGAMIYGYELPWSKMIARYAENVGAGGKSRILGPGSATVTPPAAALVNGSLAHAFEMDGATMPSAGVHPCATIFPALLAIAQDRAIGGRQVLTAFIAATELTVRIGRATKKSNEHRGFHAPSTTGPFGAAIGTALLLNLDAAKVTNAIGIAASLASGLIQFSRAGTGGMVKRLHFGRAAESGVLAGSLAADGFTGPHDVLEGEFGFLHAFCDERDVGALLRRLGEEFVTLSIYMKRFPCHGTAQAPLQALEEMQTGQRFSGPEVAEIELATGKDVVDRHNIMNPTDLTLAQYSVPFCIALACHRNSHDPRSFDQSALSDPDILSLCKRVHLTADGGHSRDAVTLTIKLTDGQVRSHRVTKVRGTPDDPPTKADVYEKFSLLTRHCPRDKMDELFARIQSLENEPDLAWISA
jgi:2-methylcitrate dehydratase PrpD